MKLKTVDDVHHAREMLEFDVDRFLRDTGWTYSSSHPGAYWLWSKTINGKTYTVPKETALNLQQALEASL